MSTYRVSSVAAAVLIAASGFALVRAQSLADVAKKEEERRKAVTEPAKVYTNKDLRPVPAGSVPAAPDAKDTKDAAGKDAKDAAGKDAKDAGKDGAASKDGGARDQKFWADKMKALREQLDRDKTFADAIQNKINSLTTDFVNRDDPIQKQRIELDRQKALAELTRLNKAVIDD